MIGFRNHSISSATQRYVSGPSLFAVNAHRTWDADGIGMISHNAVRESACLLSRKDV
jgi:hypothetical protein